LPVVAVVVVAAVPKMIHMEHLVAEAVMELEPPPKLDN
tara:strand:- start:201 stop:314 length:114 start_codon:yes stop_codon:yes gene_type:complete